MFVSFGGNRQTIGILFHETIPANSRKTFNM